ncbi:hypothetical protein [Bacteriophage sp.]|nr:hypothetical protein [Bacteriophage sp.]
MAGAEGGEENGQRNFDDNFLERNHGVSDMQNIAGRDLGEAAKAETLESEREGEQDGDIQSGLATDRTSNIGGSNDRRELGDSVGRIPASHEMVKNPNPNSGRPNFQLQHAPASHDSEGRTRSGMAEGIARGSGLAEPGPVENSAPSDAAPVHFVEKAFAPTIALNDDWGAFDELPQDDNSIAPTIALAYDNWSELWRLERNGYDTNGQARFRWRLRFADTKPSRDCGLPEHVAGQIIEGGRGKGNHAQSRADSERLKYTAEYLEGELRRGKKRGTATKKRKRERQNSGRNQGRLSMPKVSRLVDRKLSDVRGGFVN